jgi:hypothetical protein
VSRADALAIGATSRATSAARWLLRLAALTQIALGILFWTGHAATLVPVHMAVGTLFVFALWFAALLAARGGRGWRAAATLIVAGLLVSWLGMAQRTLLTGPPHWIVRVAHLLVGVLALALAEWLAPR